MATRTWIGGHAGDPNNWDDPLNWSGGVPVAGNDVVISAGANGPVLDADTVSLKSVTLQAGASLTVGSFALNVAHGITLSGVGSTITLAGGSINASAGTFELDPGAVLSGFGSVHASKYTKTGTITAQGGTLSVFGTVTNGIVLTVDPNSVSDLAILGTATASDSIAITSANDTLEVGAAGSLTISTAETITNGTIILDGGLAKLRDDFGITLGDGSTLTGSGQLSSGKGNTGLLSGTGIVQADGGTLELTRKLGSTGLQFQISNNAASVLQLDGTVGTGNTFTFLGSVGDLALGSAATFSGTIAGLYVGADTTPTNFIDILAVPGVTVSSGGHGSGSSGSVTLSDGAVLTLSGIGNAGGSWWVNAVTDAAGTGTDIFLSVVCFAAGTQILTTAGDRTVESLVPGDTVITLVGADLVARPVKWIGRRRIDLTAHPRPEIAAPVRIQRGAFADGVPHTDLLVSPDHAIFVDGKLISARQLINGSTIRAEQGWTAVEYFHVELEAHAILVANGLPAESYLDTGNRGFFANGDAPLRLHPDLTDASENPTRTAASCAPFVYDEAGVLPVWQRLAARAAAIGQPAQTVATTDDPDLVLIAGGRTLLPTHETDGRYVFLVPNDATDIRLVSRAGAPADVRPWLDDRRWLGVHVARIVLRAADALHDIPLDHPALDQGWWDLERIGAAMHRWTNGDAALTLPEFSGPAMLEVRLGGRMAYRVAAEPQARRRAA
jgi:hypothetical protein